jgi:hypothetical protein
MAFLPLIPDDFSVRSRRKPPALFATVSPRGRAAPTPGDRPSIHIDAGAFPALRMVAEWLA